MPNVAGREFPYTSQGMAAAEQYKQSLGMRNGGTAGFRPLGYRDGGDVEAANDATYSKLQTALDTLKDKEQLNNFIHENKAALESMAEASSARRETLESIKHFSNFAGFMERIMQEGEEIEELGTGIPQEMYRPGLGDYVEQFLPGGGEGTQIPTSPIMSPGAGEYGINPALLNPANQDQMEAYRGGVPGPSFSPGRGQTAPDFRNYMDTGSFRGATYGDPYFEDQLLPGGGEVPRGMRNGGIMSLRRR